MLEQTYKCNLRCPSCIQGYQDIAKEYNTNTSVMSMELYTKIIEEAKDNNLASLSMHVNDEPLLVKNIEDRIRLASEANIMDIIMTTNGVLLNKKKAHKIIEAGVTHLLFSLDSADKETYDKVRPGGDFETVVKNIEYTNSLRNNMFPILRASFVKSSLNEHQVDYFQEYFHNKVDYVDIQTFGAYKNLNNNLKPTDSKYNEGNILSCSMPYTRLIIRANGDVLPCCSFYGYDLVVGNVHKNSIKEIWNNKIMKKLRKDFKNRDYSIGKCAECMKNLAL